MSRYYLMLPLVGMAACGGLVLPFVSGLHPSVYIGSADAGTYELNVEKSGAHVLFYQRSADDQKCTELNGELTVPEIAVSIGPRSAPTLMVEAMNPPWTFHNHETCGRAIGVFSANAGTYDLKIQRDSSAASDEQLLIRYKAPNGTLRTRLGLVLFAGSLVAAVLLRRRARRSTHAG